MPQIKTKKEQHLENLGRATRVVRNSFFVLIALSLMKAFGGYTTNIVTLLGDALGSFYDLVATSAIFIGLVLSQKKASGTFKYGYHRIETLISFFISVIVIYAGGQIFVESLRRFYTPAITTDHTIGIVTAVISIGASIYIFFYQKKISETINSKALLASANDKRNDAFISLGVLVSILADKFAIPYIDAGLGIVLAVIIIMSGVIQSKESLLDLLDHWDKPEITQKIRSILEKSKVVTAVKNIRLRHAGTFIFGEAFLQTNPFTDSKDLRDEIHRLDNEVERTVEHLGDLVLYIDPPNPVRVRVAIPIADEKGLESSVADNKALPFRFLFVEIAHGKIHTHYTATDLFSINQTTEIVGFLKKHHTNILISSLISPLLYYHLRLNNIRVYPHFIDVKDVGNTVKLLLLDI